MPAAVDPLAIASQPPPQHGNGPHDSPSPPHSQPHHADEDTSFDNYCIVCDRLIIPPKQAEPEVATKPKKKVAGGTIRVKNPDGTTTTRTANGAKVTRPGLRRNPTSANRLAALSGANTTCKLTPLTRSKTDGPTSTATPSTSLPSSGSGSPSPPSAPCKAECETVFRSSIYCSRECAQTDAGRCDETYKDMARTLSFDFSHHTHPFGLESIATRGMVVSDKDHAPPSPLFISGSDTSSSNAGGEGPASSAPNTLDYFLYSRPQDDETWHDVQRQRRSSMHPNVRPVSLARERSNTSSGHGPVVDASSDSLSSLWNNTSTEQELYLARSISTGASKRSMSIHSDASAPSRPLTRTQLSQTSLAASPRPSSAMFIDGPGSVPNQTLNLLQSYASAFPSRDSLGSSASFTQRGFVGEPRRGSSNHSSGPLQRSNNGTIRARRPSEREPTWDSFGKQEVTVRNARAARAAAESCCDQGLGAHATPKQSLEVEDGRWKIKYHSSNQSSEARHPSPSGESSRSRRSSVHSGSTIPIRARLSTSASSNSHSRTPHGRIPIPMGPPTTTTTTSAGGVATPSSSVPTRPDRYAIPDLAALRIGSAGCAPYVSTDPVMPAGVHRSGFDWSAHERKGGKTYELPHGLKIDRSKAGLFYFQ